LQVQPFLDAQIALEALDVAFGTDNCVAFLRRELVEESDHLIIFVDDLHIRDQRLARDDSADEAVGSSDTVIFFLIEHMIFQVLCRR